jgi:hypothetical protein
MFYLIHCTIAYNYWGLLVEHIFENKCFTEWMIKNVLRALLCVLLLIGDSLYIFCNVFVYCNKVLLLQSLVKLYEVHHNKNRPNYIDKVCMSMLQANICMYKFHHSFLSLLLPYRKYIWVQIIFFSAIILLYSHAFATWGKVRLSFSYLQPGPFSNLTFLLTLNLDWWKQNTKILTISLQTIPTYWFLFICTCLHNQPWNWTIGS